MIDKAIANNIKKSLFLAKPKLVTRLLAFDFPSENPLAQIRNKPYENAISTSHNHIRSYAMRKQLNKPKTTKTHTCFGR